MATMYFKGGSGIENPVDINGDEIQAGDLLTTDYGDNAEYNIPEASEERKSKPFYLVEKSDKGFFFAQSIEFCTHSAFPESRFYLHDFRFKYCKKVNDPKQV